MSFPLTLNSATFDTSTPKFGSAALNGGTATLSSPIPANTVGVTLELWMKYTGTGLQVAVGDTNSCWVGSDGAGGVQCQYGSVGMSNHTVVANDGAWHHIVLDFGPWGGNLWFDGTLAATNSTSAASAGVGTSTTITYMNYGGNLFYAFPGEIDEVAWFSGQRRTASFTPPSSAYTGTETNLLALHHLDSNGTDSTNATISASFAISEATDAAAFAVTYCNASSFALSEAPDTGAFAATYCNASHFALSEVADSTAWALTYCNAATFAPTEATDAAAFAASSGTPISFAIVEPTDIASILAAPQNGCTLASVEAPDAAAFVSSVYWPASFAISEGHDAAAIAVLYCNASVMSANEPLDSPNFFGNGHTNAAFGISEAPDVFAGAITAVSPAVTLPSVTSAPYGIYASQLVIPSYNGPLYQLIRPDGATLDVTFGLDGRFVRAPVAAFVAGTTAKVSIVYDQSGNGLHATQTVDDQRPAYYLDIDIFGVQPIAIGWEPFGGLHYTYMNLPAGLAVDRQNVTVFNVGSMAGGPNNTWALWNLGTGGLNSTIALRWDEGTFYKAHTTTNNFNTGAAPPYASQFDVITVRSNATALTTKTHGVSSTETASSSLALTGGQWGSSSIGDIYSGMTVGCLAIYPGNLTDADITAVESALRSAFNVVANTADAIFFDGDSITAGFSVPNLSKNISYYILELIGKRLQSFNFAQNGQFAQQMYTNRTDTFQWYNAALTNNYLHILCGTNDINGFASGSIVGAGSTVWNSYLKPYIQGAVTTGFKPYVGTILPRTWAGSSTDQSQKETERLALNALIVANAATYGYTVVDYANISAMQDPTNFTYYYDGLHPTTTGDFLIASLFVSQFANAATFAITEAPDSAAFLVANNASLITLASIESADIPAFSVAGLDQISFGLTEPADIAAIGGSGFTSASFGISEFGDSLAFAALAQPISASFALTEAIDTAAGIMSTTARASLGAVENPDAASIAGGIIATATLASIEAPDSAAFSSAPVTNASFALTEVPDTSAFAAGIAAAIGAFALTESPDTAFVNLTDKTLASFAISETPDNLAFGFGIYATIALASSEAIDTTAFAITVLPILGMALASNEGIDTASASVSAITQAALASIEAPDTAAFGANAKTSAALASVESADLAGFTGGISGSFSLASNEAADAMAVSAALISPISLNSNESADAAAFLAAAVGQIALSATDTPDLANFASTAFLAARIAATEAADSAAFNGASAFVIAFAVTEPIDLSSIIAGGNPQISFAITEQQDYFSAKLVPVNPISFAVSEDPDVLGFNRTDNTSATGGPLLPDDNIPYDADLDAIFHPLIPGLTSLDGSLVRPRWQPVNPDIPDVGVNWCSIGVMDIIDDQYPALVEAGVNFEQSWNTEVIEVLASFFGPNGQRNAAQFRAGIKIPQNSESLIPYRIGLRSVERVVSASELMNTQWEKRFDVRLRFARQVVRTYPIKSVLELDGLISTDGVGSAPLS